WPLLAGRDADVTRQPRAGAGRTGARASIGVDPALPPSWPPRGTVGRMGIRTAWQAIAQSPRRFLASSWPWRSLAYLLAGIAPSAAVAIGVLALVNAPAGRAAPIVLAPLAGGGVAPLARGSGVGRVGARAAAAPAPRPRPRPRAGGGGRVAGAGSRLR